jgi:3-keto-5-aminohexanoate cleavage enzyme
VTPLPTLMVAPNGARKTKADHPAIPITLEETVATAVECHAAGADGLHLHIRDREGHHILDAGLYREALTELHHVVPGMVCQITTEAVGQYSPAQQRHIVDTVRPLAVSISLAEMLEDAAVDETSAFYARCARSDIAVQHILYGAQDLRVMSHMLDQGMLSDDELQLLFVLGRYSEHQESTLDDLNIYTKWLNHRQKTPDWAVCAFGKQETACLAEAHRLSGKVRVGFENSVWNADGSIAKSNRERVAELHAIIKPDGQPG